MSVPGELRVLKVTPSFYPAVRFGGPTTSNYRLCRELAARPGVVLRVLTTDTSGPTRGDRIDASDRGPALYAGYDVRFCRKLLGTAIAPGFLLRVWREVSWADVVYVSAIYSFTTLPALAAARLFRKPVVLSSHGALQRRIGTSRPLRKRLWDLFCRNLLSRKRSVLHFSSTQERDGSAAAIPGIAGRVIPHGIDIPAVRPRAWRPQGRLRLLYVGRLDPIKGLEKLLRAAARLQGVDWRLRICGDGDPRYVHSLHGLCEALGIVSRVTFAGFIDGQEKHDAYVDADICVVPSHSENFSLVVVESLAHGTPVIASVGTPWPELEARGVGRWVSNDPPTLAHAIAIMAEADLEEMSRKGREWMAREYAWSDVGCAFEDVFREVLVASRRVREGR